MVNREIHLVITEYVSMYKVETYTIRNGTKTGSVKSTYYDQPMQDDLLSAGIETHYGFVKDMLSHG